ncbi:MAG TPA: DUF4296 domain-containing protein [Chitinophagales bacterium]|nr:DUF4296 domain-containing protein [Chitinophagales bacterium]
MKRVILFALILLSACKAKLPDIPGNVIPMEKMELILADMHIADAVAETKAQMGMSEQLIVQEYHEQIFINHGVTRAEFLSSYKFYQDNPKLMDIMYDKILADLSKREQETGKQK